MQTVSLTAKNQLTIPVALLKEQAVAPGTKFAARWRGSDLVLTPIRDLADVVAAANEALRPLITRPMTDEELKKNLREWPKEKP
jgi:hypothetical protein